MRLLCTVLFLSVVFASPASAQLSNGAWEMGVGPHVIYRERSSSTHAGGGVTLARRFQPLAVVVEASGTRRQGHNDWRAIGGPRATIVRGGRALLFAQVLAGALIRSRHADLALLPGLGVDVRWAETRAVRFQVDAPIERSQGRTAASVRGSVWLVF